MYIELKKDIDPIVDSKVFFSSDTSVIYKDNGILYKIYLRYEPKRRDVLDYLISIKDEISDISTPPINKVKLDNKYGMTMKYIPNKGFYRYFLHEEDSNDYLDKIKKLSDNLKILNSKGIYFTDLHHNNIIIDQNDNPIYIDLDDARVNNYKSNHICYLVRNLHDIDDRGLDYERELLDKAYLDRESLVLLTLNYLYKDELEKLSYDEYQKRINELKGFINDEVLDKFRELKNKLSNKDIPLYEYYIGDYIDEEFKSNYSLVKKKVRK
jgi:hypothetical protein